MGSRFNPQLMCLYMIAIVDLYIELCLTWLFRCVEGLNTSLGVAMSQRLSTLSALLCCVGWQGVVPVGACGSVVA